LSEIEICLYRNRYLFLQMIVRKELVAIKSLLDAFPAVALLGARQVGKTTLAKQLSPLYFDLEIPEERTRLDVLWPRLIADNELLILDEAQTWPELFPRLRSTIDQRREQRSRFLLLGSVAPSLMKHVAESLAGRLAIMELNPLHLNDLPSDQGDALWQVGGFPDGGILQEKAFPLWQRNYLRLIVERDLPNLGLMLRPLQGMRLLEMTALLHANVLNATQLGESLGVSYHTAQHYLDYLQGIYLVRELRPYAANELKRLTRRPKLYWRDSGLLHALRGLQQVNDLLSQPWVGASWEGFCLEQILQTCDQLTSSPKSFYFRTSDGLETDLLLEWPEEIHLVEIKLTTSPSPHDFTPIEKIARLLARPVKKFSSPEPNTPSQATINFLLIWPTISIT
jgi:uncharacterized protein